MNRKSILTLLFSIYLVAFGLFALWIGQAWASSSAKLARVKGISTVEASALTPELAPYPVPTKAKPSIQAKEYLLYNAESGKVLAQSAVLDPVPIASTTKLMTAYVVAELLPLDQTVTISKQAADQIGSTMNLQAGQTISVRNLLYGALLVSGNDAAYALAEQGGEALLNQPQASTDAKVARFVDEMNATAQKIRMENTQYQDPVGLNDEGYSTPLDLAKLASLVNTNSVLKPMINTATTTVWDTTERYKFELKNSNRLVGEMLYEGIIGGKTGFTPGAGHCLVTSAERNGITLTAVVLYTFSNAPEASALESRKLLEFGFSQISWQ